MADLGSSKVFGDLTVTGEIKNHALEDALDSKDPAGSAADAQAYAVQRANHTGTQAVDTVLGLRDELDDLFALSFVL